MIRRRQSIMNIERIKAVELLVTLKGMAPDNSKQQIWHVGTVFKKPFPRNIVAELALNRPGVLKVIEEEPPSEPEVIEPEKLETLDVLEKQKEDPAQPKTDKEPLEDTQDVPPKKPKRKSLKKLTKAG
jgi:hypothetical protein